MNEPTFENTLKPAAASVLFNVYRSRIQREAALYLSKSLIRKVIYLPSKQLMASTDNSMNGQSIFKMYCVSCHKIKGEGVKFGPEPFLIGDKLSKKDYTVRSFILTKAVNYVTFADGYESMDIVASKTANEIILNMPGGSPIKHARSSIQHIAKSDRSLMRPLLVQWLNRPWLTWWNTSLY